MAHMINVYCPRDKRLNQKDHAMTVIHRSYYVYTTIYIIMYVIPTSYRPTCPYYIHS